MRTLRRLLASPHAIYGFTDLRRGVTTMGLRYPDQIDLERWVPVFDAHFWQHPLNGCATQIAIGQVVTMPRLVTADGWARTGNYNEFCRPNGIEHQLMMRLPSASGIMEAIGIARYDRDFNDDECDLFERMKPHVLVAHRRARLLAEVAPPLPLELGGWQTAHLVLDGDGKPGFVGAGCEALFERFFAAPAMGAAIPDELRAWARAQLRALPGAATPPAELVREAEIDGRPFRLRGWLVPQLTRGLHDVYLQARAVETDEVIRTDVTLQSAGGLAAADDLTAQIARVSQRWKLRPRQRDVLALLVRGQSNQEIAAHLGCVEVTVEYHVTGLLRRTGSSNRASLVTRFWNER
jgi:DNA-binding CsgD family transcriptional regulator